MKKIIVASRKSALALTQTNWVISRLREQHPSYQFEVKKIVTKGDRILDVSLSKVGGKGLFVKEIEAALLDGEADFAVHSMKDMPGEIPEGLTIGAVPRRVDPRDVMISRGGLPFEELPEGAVIGTSSLRRSAQLAALRPDLQIMPIRGNVDTRIRKLQDGECDAIILAAAGLQRLEWDGDITQFLPVEISIPAVGQGALAIECREGDRAILDLLSVLNDKETELAVRAERAFQRTLEGGCQVPIGAFAQVQVGTESDFLIHMTGFVATPDGSVFLKDQQSGTDPEALGNSLGMALKDRGAGEILDKVRLGEY